MADNNTTEEPAPEDDGTAVTPPGARDEPGSRAKGIREWFGFTFSAIALVTSVTTFVFARIAAKEQKHDAAISIVREVDATLAADAAIQSELRLIGMKPGPLVGEVEDCTLSDTDVLALNKAATRLQDALAKDPESQPAFDRLLFIARTLDEPVLLDAWRSSEDIRDTDRMRIALVSAALKFDLQALDAEMARVRALPARTDELVTDAAWALKRVGRIDEAIQVLQQQSVDGGTQVAFDLADALSKHVLMDNARASDAMNAVQLFRVRAPQQQLRAVMLEHDVQVALGNFDDANLIARRALLETLTLYPQAIPHRWVNDLLNASVLSGDAQLRILDDAIKACPSQRPMLERSRISPLIEARRCNDALAAAAAADVTGFLHDVYEVLITPVPARREQLLNVEARLEAAKPDDKFIPLVVGVAGWSLDDAGKAQRAAWIANGIEDFLPAPDQTTGIAAETMRESRKEFEATYFGGMDTDVVIKTLRDYGQSGSKARLSAPQRKFLGSLQNVSRSILTEDTAAICRLAAS